ncbi:MAG: hypothetical protein JWL93_812, partial [Hyphomicrobiales bacterium]|nr:hypothetical protein [Hyphomicrobiales bacterium]
DARTFSLSLVGRAGVGVGPHGPKSAPPHPAASFELAGAPLGPAPLDGFAPLAMTGDLPGLGATPTPSPSHKGRGAGTS